MISTIVSRCQCFFVPAQLEEDRDFSLVSGIMEGYTARGKNELWKFKDELLAIIKEHGFGKTIEQVENYLNSLLKNNYDNAQLLPKTFARFESCKFGEKTRRPGHTSPERH